MFTTNPGQAISRELQAALSQAEHLDGLYCDARREMEAWRALVRRHEEFLRTFDLLEKWEAYLDLENAEPDDTVGDAS